MIVIGWFRLSSIFRNMLLCGILFLNKGFFMRSDILLGIREVSWVRCDGGLGLMYIYFFLEVLV